MLGAAIVTAGPGDQRPNYSTASDNVEGTLETRKNKHGWKKSFNASNRRHSTVPSAKQCTV
jgi:hypothetical protein